MTALDDLMRLVPPPANPAGGPADWAAAEAGLGLRLPGDFKAMADRYGQGEFCDLISLQPDLPGYNADVLEDERGYQEDDPDDYPYPLYPAPGGILIWGGTSNGDWLCWLTEGGPEEWPVVVWTPRGAEWELYRMGAAAFLEGWLAGRVAAFPDAFRATAQWFDPVQDLTHVYVRLTESTLPYEQRYAHLREALAPTADRMRVGPEESRQDKFAAAGGRWRVMYETAYRHQIRIAFPPGDNDRARTAVLRAAALMGCQVDSADRLDSGTMVPVWL
ncbi:SMI1/KNR4 family protein [Winogradskya consettensis]|nr:SMI1/KNR4 family protein [Actinoplanes consettensis]